MIINILSIHIRYSSIYPLLISLVHHSKIKVFPGDQYYSQLMTDQETWDFKAESRDLIFWSSTFCLRCQNLLDKPIWRHLIRECHNFNVLQKPSHSREVDKTLEETKFIVFLVSLFAVSDTLTLEYNFIFLSICICLLPNSEIIIHIYNIVPQYLSV